MKLLVRWFLIYMIINNLVQEINWMGKGEKVVFFKLNLFIVLKGKKIIKLNVCDIFVYIICYLNCLIGK